MAILNILRYPDPRLHTIAQPVVAINDDVKRFVADLAETMYAAPGVGLAATQVNRHQQIIVVDTSETRDQLLVLINPIIVERSGSVLREEGCLSVPGVFEKVARADSITVQALDSRGASFTLKAHDFLAVCIQHEIDHLMGKVFVEYLSPLKRSRLQQKLKKQARATA